MKSVSQQSQKMSVGSKSSSLFDEIFRLQNTAPDVDVDPEDQEEGFKASLVDDSREDVETFGATALRKRAAIISNDPKYKGKKTSRKELYSDDDFSDVDLNSSFGLASPEADDSEEEGSADDGDNESDEEESDSYGEEKDEEEDDEDAEKEESAEDEEMPVSNDMDATESTVKVPSSKTDDREKGKAVHHQIGIWDDLIKSRIALQKVVLSCNRLPQPDTWPSFANVSSFRKEASNVHSSVRKLVSALLELQLLLSTDEKTKSQDKRADSDEEITSESEGEEEDVNSAKKAKQQEDEIDEEEEDEEEELGDEEENEDEAMEIERHDGKGKFGKSSKLKRKLDVGDVEETLAKRHTDFQKIRNDTLSKWDEKTRLIHGKIQSKNFAAFEMSVLKQIEQVLVNRERLVKRIHQQRSVARVLGRPEDGPDDNEVKDEAVDDDEEEVEVKQRQKSEAPVDYEIIDDSDFYHICLRDLLETKQSEELDPVTASKQRLEIQRLRNKQKKKVDTRASKGRKIRYHVKEKLKNYMTPYDKSSWSDEQKDDLFKAIFGAGLKNQDTEQQISVEKPTINIGL